MFHKGEKMAKLETVRNASIGIAVMILLPTITYVGTRLLFKEPSYPIYADRNEPQYKTQVENYYKGRQDFNKYYFYVSSIIGLLAIIAGAFVVPIPFLGMGFILGGTFCLIGGYYYHWSGLTDMFKFISLLVALFVLVMSSFKLANTKTKRA